MIIHFLIDFQYHNLWKNKEQSTPKEQSKYRTKLIASTVHIFIFFCFLFEQLTLHNYAGSAFVSFSFIIHDWFTYSKTIFQIF